MKVGRGINTAEPEESCWVRWMRWVSLPAPPVGLKYCKTKAAHSQDVGIAGGEYSRTVNKVRNAEMESRHL